MPGRYQIVMRTRCPACNTVFRVTSDQLRAKAGKVRCGQCRALFNAFDELFEDAATMADSVPGKDAEVVTAASPVASDRLSGEVSESGVPGTFTGPESEPEPEPEPFSCVRRPRAEVTTNPPAPLKERVHDVLRFHL